MTRSGTMTSSAQALARSRAHYSHGDGALSKLGDGAGIGWRLIKRRRSMPAVTTDNLLLLPRLPRPERSPTTFRPVARVVTAPTTLEGAGFQVRRAFPGADGHLA